jgi:hypothetical protein
MEKKTIYQVVRWSSYLGDTGVEFRDSISSYWESIEDAYKVALSLQKVSTYEETLEGIDEDDQTYFVVQKIIVNPSKIN